MESLHESVIMDMHFTSFVPDPFIFYLNKQIPSEHYSRKAIFRGFYGITTNWVKRFLIGRWGFAEAGLY
jgi:hypothetical protein